MSFRTVGYLLVFWLLASCQSQPPAPPAPTPAAPTQEPQFKADLLYQDRVPPDYPVEVDPGLEAALSVLALQPGMKVLLLGPESGYLSFPVARAVGPSGAVLTLCDYRFNEIWLQDRGASAGLVNLKAAFYPEFQWDSLPKAAFQRVVLVDFRSQAPLDPALVPRLAQALAPEGKLVVFHRKELADFSPRALWSPLEVLRQLCVYGPEFPLRRRLSPALETLVQDACKEGARQVPPAFPLEFLATLNDLVQDRTLYRDLSQYFNDRSGYAAEITAFFNEDPPLRVLQWYDNAFGYLLLDDREPLTPGGQVAVGVVNHLVLSALFAIRTQRPDRFLEETTLYPPEGLRAAMEAGGLGVGADCQLFGTHHCQLFKHPGVNP